MSQVVTYVALQVNLEEIKLVGQAHLFSACRVNVYNSVTVKFFVHSVPAVNM